MGTILEYQTPPQSKPPKSELMADIVIGGAVQIVSVGVACEFVPSDAIGRICFYVGVGYWVGLFTAGIRRGRAPTKGDHFYIMFAYPLLLISAMFYAFMRGWLFVTV